MKIYFSGIMILLRQVHFIFNNFILKIYKHFEYLKKFPEFFQNSCLNLMYRCTFKIINTFII